MEETEYGDEDNDEGEEEQLLLKYFVNITQCNDDNSHEQKALAFRYERFLRSQFCDPKEHKEYTAVQHKGDGKALFQFSPE